MAIEFTFKRINPLINRSTNNVEKFVIGLSAQEDEFFAYIDTAEPVPEPYKSLENWTIDEIRNFALSVAEKYDWYNVLTEQINAQKNQPKFGSNINI